MMRARKVFGYIISKKIQIIKQKLTQNWVKRELKLPAIIGDHNNFGFISIQAHFINQAPIFNVLNFIINNRGMIRQMMDIDKDSHIIRIFKAEDIIITGLKGFDINAKENGSMNGTLRYSQKCQGEVNWKFY